MAGREKFLASVLARSTAALNNECFILPVSWLILLSAFIMHMNATLNHDTSWYLVAGEKLLGGQRLYRDIIEVNPPLGLILTLPATAVAKISGLFAVDVFIVYAYALIIFSLTLTRKVMHGLTPIVKNGLYAAAALVLSFHATEAFGQREHLMIAFTLPYMALSWLRISGAASCSRPLAIAVGAFAALGFALKPHYLLVPFALEIYRLVLTRRWLAVLRPETITLGLAVLLYLAAIVILTPEYLNFIVPYALESYNAAYHAPLAALLVRVETFFLPLGLLLHYATRNDQRAPALTAVFLIAALCYFTTYLIQSKGWYYHLYPASACLLMAYINMFLGALGQNGARQAAAPLITRTAFFIAFEIALLLAAVNIVKGPYNNPFMREATPVVERYARGSSIALLGTNLWPGFPLTNYSGADWALRFPTLWMLPGIIQKKETGGVKNGNKLEEIENYMRDAVIDDLITNRPAVILVDIRERKSYFGDEAFDYVDYFRQDARFAVLWEEYRPEPGLESYGIRMYRRR